MDENKKNDVVAEPDAQEAQPQEKKSNAVGDFVKDDLLGAKDWKRSKIGYLTGFSSVAKMGSAFASDVAGSASRLGRTFKLVTASEYVPELQEDQLTLEGKEKFQIACRLQNMTRQKLDRAIKNTHRSFNFYAALLGLAVFWFGVDLILKDSMRLTTYVLHVAPIPVLGAFLFKAGYTNWMFRMESLDSPKVYLRDRRNLVAQPRKAF